MGRMKGKPNRKQYKRMTLDRHIYLSLIALLMTTGKSYTQARKTVKAILKTPE